MWRIQLQRAHWDDLATSQVDTHAIIEVLHKTLTGKLSDLRISYVLRWIAGMRAEIPEFNPPYTVV